MKALVVVGARPQFVKAAPLLRALSAAGHEAFLVHTGQHYDEDMSALFFEELAIAEPRVNLGVGSAPRGEQVRAMLDGLQPVVADVRPEWVIVLGDTNSTLAGALAASLADVSLAHVEAGLRSFDRSMPEEANRLIADHLSSLLLCPGEAAVANLDAEGRTDGVRIVGDVMLDALQMVGDRPEVLERAHVVPGGYVFATIHRAANTDDARRLSAILEAFGALSEPVVFPVHPRTDAAIRDAGMVVSANIRILEPTGYAETVALARRARVVATDSGGLQKEAYWLGVPCVTLRETTEWVETVETGWNTLAGTDPARIVEAIAAADAPSWHPALYGEPGAAGRCVEAMEGG